MGDKSIERSSPWNSPHGFCFWRRNFRWIQPQWLRLDRDNHLERKQHERYCGEWGVDPKEQLGLFGFDDRGGRGHEGLHARDHRF